MTYECAYKQMRKYKTKEIGPFTKGAINFRGLTAVLQTGILRAKL